MPLSVHNTFCNSVPAFLSIIMRFFSSALLVLTALASTNSGKVLLKRGLLNYSGTSASPAYASAGSGQQAYTKAFRPSTELKQEAAPQQYVAQPVAYSSAQPAATYSSPSAQQYYQQIEPQAVAYSQPAVSKYSGSAPALQKYSFAQQAQPQQYSSAADVSSFSYSSPVVSYNNLGYLHQIIGKGAGAQQQPQQQQTAYSAAPSPKIQYVSSPSQYSAGQNNYERQNTYQALSQKAAYSEAPQYQSQAYAQAQAQAQAQAAQEQAIAEAQAQAKAQSQQSQAQAVTFQSASPGAQKVSYLTIPNYQALQKASSPQVNYVTSPQVTYTPQTASQSYESGAHSTPQVFYSQPAAQPQYYTIPQAPKYARAGITYGQ